MERCEKHQAFDGAAKPRNRCEGCWRLYLRSEGVVEALTDLDRQRSSDEVRRLKAANKKLRRAAEENETLGRIARAVEAKAVKASWKAAGRRVGKGKHPSIALMDVSDEHWGEVVRPEQVNGINAYNTEIAAKRIRNFYEHGLELARNYTAGLEYVAVCLVLGGDHTSGSIHEELDRTNEMTALESIRPLRDLHVTGIRRLLDFFPAVRVVRTAGGNHGRTDKRMPAKGVASRNFDKLLDDLILEQFVGDSRVSWNSGMSQQADFELFTTRFTTVHGHQFKGGSGISGALAPLLLGRHRMARLAQASGRGLDWLLVHHFHSLMLGTSGVLVNGTIKGYDEYALSKAYPPEPPQQLFCVVDPKHGLTMRAPIFCEAADEGWRGDR